MVGIDLGTTNSLVFQWDDSLEDVVSLSGLIPSVVDTTSKSVGKKAKAAIRQGNASGDTIFSSFKVDIAQDYSVAASCAVLKELKAYTKEVDCVITVPAYFSSLQRQNTKKAAEAAGLKVHALLNEPTAAAIYYNRTNKRASLIYDLGGGTFDISLIDSRNGGYEVMATDGLKLGGDDLDRFIAQAIMSDCKYHPAAMPYDVASLLFKSIAEEAKIFIQKTGQDYEFDISSLPIGKAVDNPKVHVTVDFYKQSVEFILGRTVKRALSVIEASGYHKDELTLVLVGGSTRDPYLREYVEENLGIKPVPLTYNPDEIVAQGAAFYAHMLEIGTAEDEVSDVTNAIKLLLADDTLTTVIPKNSFLPIETVYIVSNGETSTGIEFEVYEGDFDTPQKEGYLGTLKYDFIDGEKEANTAIVTCRFKFNSSGILSVSAFELDGEEVKIELAV